MILLDTLSAEWLKSVSSKLGKVDVSLLEKAVRALLLAEQLKVNDLTFVFKGGTSLLLHLEKPLRFSIDVDIITSDDKATLIKAMDAVVKTGAFTRWEADERTLRKDLPVDHYKFFYKSQFPSPTAENYVLLDVLYQNPLPVWVQQKAMQHPWLKTAGEPVQLTLSTIGGLLGDKLTAFAPTTTGILYTKDRPVEIIKQLFDIGCLYNLVDNLAETQTAFQTVAAEELKYRGLTITASEVLSDSFSAALTVCDRNLKDPNFQHLAKGIHNIKPHIFYRFVIEDAMVGAAKVMLLSTLLRQDFKETPHKFGMAKDVIDWLIPTTDYNRFNKLKKTNPEAFFYIYKTCEHLNQPTT
ncbi:MAG: nucleotidyl transferase AbiEii/AbiGii toxin family protein [Saprospiraceae bacterium]